MGRLRGARPRLGVPHRAAETSPLSLNLSPRGERRFGLTSQLALPLPPQAGEGGPEGFSSGVPLDQAARASRKGCE